MCRKKKFNSNQLYSASKLTLRWILPLAEGSSEYILNFDKRIYFIFLCRGKYQEQKLWFLKKSDFQISDEDMFIDKQIK